MYMRFCGMIINFFCVSLCCAPIKKVFDVDIFQRRVSFYDCKNIFFALHAFCQIWRWINLFMLAIFFWWYWERLLYDMNPGKENNAMTVTSNKIQKIENFWLRKKCGIFFWNFKNRYFKNRKKLFYCDTNVICLHS
jgi:hypothetical protein